MTDSIVQNKLKKSFTAFARTAFVLLACTSFIFTACGGGGGGGGSASGSSSSGPWGNSSKITIPLNFSKGKSVTDGRAAFSDGVMALGWDSMTLTVTQKQGSTASTLYEGTFAKGDNPDDITVEANVGARVEATATFHIPSESSITGSEDTRTASGVIESVKAGKNMLTLYVKYKYWLRNEDDEIIKEGTYTAQTGYSLPTAFLDEEDGYLKEVEGGYKLLNCFSLADVSGNDDIAMVAPGEFVAKTGDLVFIICLGDPVTPLLNVNGSGYITGINTEMLDYFGGSIHIEDVVQGIPVRGFAPGFTFTPYNGLFTDVNMSWASNLSGALPDSLFKNCTSLQRIYFPSNLTSIGNNTFEGCTQLNFRDTGSDFPESLETIGSGAFKGCSALDALPMFGNTHLTSISSEAFMNSGLVYIDVPSSVTFIGNDVFSGCGSLTSVNFYQPDRLDSIGERAFYGCEQLGYIGIPDSVRTIGQSAFMNCTSLQTVNINGDQLTSIGASAFKGCTQLSSINIPGGVERIADRAFENCSALVTVMLNEGTTIIGPYAFASTGVTHIEFPSSLEILEEGAFANCPSLEGRVNTESIGAISGQCFANCPQISEFIMPNVTTLDLSAFNGCTGLSDLRFGVSNPPNTSGIISGINGTIFIHIPYGDSIDPWTASSLYGDIQAYTGNPPTVYDDYS